MPRSGPLGRSPPSRRRSAITTAAPCPRPGQSAAGPARFFRRPRLSSLRRGALVPRSLGPGRRGSPDPLAPAAGHSAAAAGSAWLRSYRSRAASNSSRCSRTHCLKASTGSAVERPGSVSAYSSCGRLVGKILAADGCRRARGRAACGSASAASRPRRCARCRGSGVAPARRTITTSMRHFSAMRARMRLTPCDGRGWLSLYFVETRRQRQVPFIRVRRSEARSPKETLVAVSIEPPDGYWFGVAFHCHLAQRSCRSGGGAQRCHH